MGKHLPSYKLREMEDVLANYEPIQLLPGQVIDNDPDGLLQAQKEEQPKKTAPRKKLKLDALSEWPGFKAVKR